MSKNLYITTVEAKSGKSAISLGIMQLLLSGIQKVAFFRPIISQDQERDHDINLILKHFNLDTPYESTYAYTLRQARDFINRGQHGQLMENILAKYKEIEKEHDFVLLEGTDFQAAASAFEFDINAEIAENLGSPVLIVLNSQDKNDEELISSALMALESFQEKGLDIMALAINRYEGDDPGAVEAAVRERTRKGEDLCLSIIPEDPALSKPSMAEIKKWLDAEVLYGEDRLEALVHGYLVAAMHIGNFLEYIEKDSLIITPGDRADIILSSLVSRVSTNYPDAAGIVLTGGIRPNRNVARLIEGWTGAPLAVLLCQDHTYKTTRRLYDLYGRIDPDNQRKVATALGLFESHVDAPELSKRLVAARTEKITPKMFEYSLIQKAKENRQRIVFPEGEGERILRATEIILKRQIADITLLGR
ncbi:MAG: phosphate acyltransferase, partial [Desulfovibrionaceae bacterium]